MDASFGQKAVDHYVDTSASKKRLNLAGQAGLGGVLAGGWLAVSPFIVGFETESGPTASALIAGVTIAVLSGFCTAFARQPGWRAGRWIAAWIVAWTAGWVWIAPFVLGYTDKPGAMWNSFLTGVLSSLSTAGAMVYATGITSDEDLQNHPTP